MNNSPPTWRATPLPLQLALFLALGQIGLASPTHAQVPDAGCSAAPCLAPSLSQADALFAAIESAVPTYFSPTAATQAVPINGRTAHIRTYTNAAQTGLGTYDSGLWYALNGSWMRFSSLDAANTTSCNGTCWSGTTSSTTHFKGEVWADNWFALYVGDTKVAEDQVSITTERSFNSETFFFDASFPLELNFIVKDYKADDTGLEYIGTTRQQMGDGGFIMQITNTSTGQVVAVSNEAMKCRVIHKAPLNTACASSPTPTVASCGATIVDEPADWKTPGYNTSQWETASSYTAAQIGVKDGYDQIAWTPSAKLVWTSDLKSDNTLLCKLTVAAP